MRFICDECVSTSLINALQEAGCDVVDIGVEDSGAGDRDILKRSMREAGVIVTHDYDFGDLIFRDGEPAFGVVIIAMARPEGLVLEVHRTVRQLMASYEMLVDHMTIMTDKGLRQRPIKKAM
jgi:predicted nuclease of predicted toxin-antitoxin system